MEKEWAVRDKELLEELIIYLLKTRFSGGAKSSELFSAIYVEVYLSGDQYESLDQYLREGSDPEGFIFKVIEDSTNINIHQYWAGKWPKFFISLNHPAE